VETTSATCRLILGHAAGASVARFTFRMVPYQGEEEGNGAQNDEES
jgi:hypothetical protein